MSPVRTDPDPAPSRARQGDLSSLDPATGIEAGRLGEQMSGWRVDAGFLIWGKVRLVTMDKKWSVFKKQEA